MQNTGLSFMVLVCAGGWLLLGGCIPDDANRCRAGYVLLDGSCWVDSDSDSNSGTLGTGDTDEATVTDSGTVDLPDGLGDPCQDDGDCAGEVATFCAKEPGQEDIPGSCAIADCADGTNVCPADLGLVCCAFSNLADYPSMCVPPSTYEEYKDLVGC